MKYLHNYTEPKQTELFNKLGVFFAFSQSQLKEKQILCVVYVQMGAGMIAPKANAVELLAGLDRINKEGITADIEENGEEVIIKRELCNYECQYVGDCTEAIEALDGYEFKEERIREIFHSMPYED